MRSICYGLVPQKGFAALLDGALDCGGEDGTEAGTLGAFASAWSWGQKGPGALWAHRWLSDDALMQMGRKQVFAY